MQVQVSVLQMSSSPTFPCMERSSSFDTCANKAILKQLETKCFPLFMEINKNGSNGVFCQNFNASLEGFTIFQSIPDKCRVPCTQVHVEGIQMPIDALYHYINEVPVKNAIPAYYFLMSQDTIVSEVFINYSFVSYVADIGGWIPSSRTFYSGLLEVSCGIL